MRVYFSPGRFIRLIRVSVNQCLDGEWRTHTHGEGQGEHICASLLRIDPDLRLQNAIHKAATSDPVTSTNVVIANAREEVLRGSQPLSRSAIQQIHENKVSVRRFIANVRGYRKSGLTMADLEQIQVDLDTNYHNAIRNRKDSAGDMVRIIGLHQVSVNFRQADTLARESAAMEIDLPGTLAELVVTFSTNNMLHLAARCKVVLVDATFKVNTAAYPLIVCGTVDVRNQFRPLSISIVKSETTASYTKVFQQLQVETERVSGISFAPECIMADSASAISASISKVFNHKYSRINGRFPALRRHCYFHVINAIEKRLLYSKYKLENAEQILKDLIGHIRIISGSYSIQRFKKLTDELRSHWSENRTILRILNAEKGFFDPSNEKSNWYWIPNNGEDLSAAWHPMTNNGLESFNNILKTDLTSKKLKSFQQVIHLLAGEKLIPAYSSTIKATICRDQSYLSNGLNEKMFSLSVEMIQPGGHFLNRSAKFDGDTFAISDEFMPSSDLRSEGLSKFINQDQGLVEKIQLLYFPRDITWIERNPQDGGPICTCYMYRRANRCWHVLFVATRMKGLIVENKNFKLGRPVRECGLTRPRQAPSALKKMK
jgi:hypothetical protein